MTGPVGTVFQIDASKISSRDGIFSCGGWESDDSVTKCKRQADSGIEIAYWSLTRKYVAGEVVTLSPDMSPMIYVDVKDRNWGSVLANATSIIACPKVDYCAGS